MRLIDADAAQKIADEELSVEDAGTVQYVLSHAPTIEAEPVRHGRWIMRGGKRYCSYCNKRACVTRDREDFWYTVGTEYCPTCGAIMDGGVSDEG